MGSELTNINYLIINPAQQTRAPDRQASVLSGRLLPSKILDNDCHTVRGTRKCANHIPTFSLGLEPYMTSQRQRVIKVSIPELQNSEPQEATLRNFTLQQTALASALTILILSMAWPLEVVTMLAYHVACGTEQINSLTWNMTDFF